MDAPDKDEELAQAISECQRTSKKTYGYRRVTIWLARMGVVRNPKTVLRVMRKFGQLSEIRRRRKYRSMSRQLQQLHFYPNILNRDFQADAPNRKWVTDISYIHTAQGVVYLSIIQDLYDRSIVSYKVGSEQTVNLVLNTLKAAKEKENINPNLKIHSDQGFQYTSRAYHILTKQYGLEPSMSRRGNCYDNAVVECFFGILKSECINRHKLLSIDEARFHIDEYIHFYNHERVQYKTKQTPLEKRCLLA
jgi:transposase InsO family protein